jgi:phosphopantetheine--protein transferase-like protein
MEGKIKEIVSVFIKVDAGDIGPATPVDRVAVKSSILLHRMYARLAEAGFAYENYSAIRVFGDLLSPASAVDSARVTPETTAAPEVSDSAFLADGTSFPGNHWPEIGIDIEAISSLPRTADFRTTEFYRMNFSAEEIAYCILQPDPYSSFAGLFVAKEAVIKADEQYKSKQFNSLAIRHTREGKPFFPGFSLSIAHANEMAVAVAVRIPAAAQGWQASAASLSRKPEDGKKSSRTSPIAWLALLLGLAALLITLLH